MARFLIILGLLTVAVGVLITLIRHVPFLGRLPGDIRIEREGFKVYFPLATCILLSLVLTLILNLFRK